MQILEIEIQKMEDKKSQLLIETKEISEAIKLLQKITFSNKNPTQKNQKNALKNTKIEVKDESKID
ncbi:Ni,Fe-hydrogenase III large subunit [Undibacterium sp. GrIS 1.8]|uniref:hypothetical protein n=1 Tax=Undibacterium sp. GrIS 1.8 TaxID=3143934 RepID=UPI0033941BCD